MRCMLLMNSYLPPSHLSKPFNPTPPLLPTTPNFLTADSRRISTTSSFAIKESADVAPTTTTEEASASHVVRSFYGGINNHDLASVQHLIAENCVYEDLVFSRPFAGRKAILEFFQKFIASTSKDLQFVIDDMSTEDSLVVGVTWHLEWNGKPFPFSKGCSFYRLEIVDGKRQIIYGRDCVEPAIKPGEAVLVVIRSVSWLFQQFPQLADRVSKMNM